MRFLQRVERSPFLAFVASRHPPQYFFVGDDSADLHFDPSRLPQGWRLAAEVIHFGSISLARQPLAACLCQEATQAAGAGKRIAFDPNYRTLMNAPGYGETLAHMLRLRPTSKSRTKTSGVCFQHWPSTQHSRRCGPWHRTPPSCSRAGPTA